MIEKSLAGTTTETVSGKEGGGRFGDGRRLGEASGEWH